MRGSGRVHGRANASPTTVTVAARPHRSTEYPLNSMDRSTPKPATMTVHCAIRSTDHGCRSLAPSPRIPSRSASSAVTALSEKMNTIEGTIAASMMLA